jgi:hypothetical protein
VNEYFGAHWNSSIFSCMIEAIEILPAQELAQRLKVKTSWVMHATQPAPNSDPLPIIKSDGTTDRDGIRTACSPG